MRRGWLAPLARSDGRSLIRALAALLFLGAFVSGLHAGFAAAPGAYAAVICHGAGDGAPLAPGADHEHDCCLAGTAPSPLPPVSAAADAAFPTVLFALRPEGQCPPLHGALTRAGPRAPPVFPA
jgi:hypothetical protein